MGKTTLIKKRYVLLCVLLSSLSFTFAQIVIGAPNLGFTQACASPTFNSYTISFVFSPASGLSGSNQFSIEMSGPDGDFTNAQIIHTSAAGEFTTSPATITFSLPDTTAGEGYKLRVKSSAPVATSSRSAAFAAYYKIQDNPFSINNLVSTGAYCAGGSYLLTIDNPGFGANNSPLNYPSLTFNWFKVTSPTTSVFVAQGNSLDVNAEGTYFAKTNYGTCTSGSFSNRVTISAAVDGEANATINSNLGNPFCPDQGMTTLTTIGGNGYQWFKDGVAIDEATNQMYQTDESGVFSVQVDLGSCQASGSIDLISESFTTTLNVSEVNEMEAGESLEVIATTSAENATFEWFFNDVKIEGESSDRYTASEFGNYKLIIGQTSGCEVSVEYPFEVLEAIDMFPDVPNIPNVISPNGDRINDTWVLPTQYVTGSNTEVMIMTNQGKVVLQTNDYQNNWPTEQLNLSAINQVFYYIITPQNSETKKGSITVIK